MALLNDVMSVVRLDVEVYHNARVCGNWRINEHKLGAACFHLPTQGKCKLCVPGEGEWQLEERDIVIFPKELPHSMVPCDSMVGDQKHFPIAESQHLDGTSMLCGWLMFQHAGGEQLLQLLPKVLVIRAAQSRDWLAPITQLIVAESLRGAELHSPVLSRLCELLMIFSLRWFAERNTHEHNLLALYANTKLRLAVSAMHQKPAERWTLSMLAKKAGMSRTSFSDLFSNTAGMTTMQYLCWWRMQLAWSELTAGRSVEFVADAVGYRSEAAFCRAFKKQFGKTVGAVRAVGR